MKKIGIQCPIIISKFAKHEQIKFQVLKEINDVIVPLGNITENYDSVNISKSDWDIFRYQPNRPWLEIFRPHLMDHLVEQTKFMGYAKFTIKEIWFQQYNVDSYHGWHVHGYNWTSVYYLDLPDNSPKTQMINPFDQTTISEFEIEEGDILTFPSFVVHRAPVNKGDRKTIISWNMDTDLVPGLYKE